ncbi:hypothetical protein V9W64_08885 [Neisseria leonii]|uniref:Lipoprotein n=1 Tax=Neisseria leonii TaxID=2995413 RepID=A0A9X4E445_9NEIS|nr:hypothetical protein [Neisseria sp. 51.81]MDD9327646.1 hypothetical protein [Neisseria sp. 51.81]
MKKSACAILAYLSVSGCSVGLIVDEIVTDGRISQAVNENLNYNKKLNRLLPACLKDANTDTAFCEKMNARFQQDRPSWKVIESTLLCAKKDGYDQFDACYAMAKRSFSNTPKPLE